MVHNHHQGRWKVRTFLPTSIVAICYLVAKNWHISSYHIELIHCPMRMRTFCNKNLWLWRQCPKPANETYRYTSQTIWSSVILSLCIQRMQKLQTVASGPSKHDDPPGGTHMIVWIVTWKKDRETNNHLINLSDLIIIFFLNKILD